MICSEVCLQRLGTSMYPQARHSSLATRDRRWFFVEASSAHASVRSKRNVRCPDFANERQHQDSGALTMTAGAAAKGPSRYLCTANWRGTQYPSRLEPPTMQTLQAAGTKEHVRYCTRELLSRPRNVRLTTLQACTRQLQLHSAPPPPPIQRPCFLPSYLPTCRTRLDQQSNLHDPPTNLRPSCCRKDTLPRNSPPAVPIRTGQEKMLQCFSCPFLFPARLSPEPFIYTASQTPAFPLPHLHDPILSHPLPSHVSQRCRSPPRAPHSKRRPTSTNSTSNKLLVVATANSP